MPEATTRPVTLFIVDDHPLVREGLTMLFAASGEVKVVGTAASASGAVADLAASDPEVVLLDLDLGGEDGLAWLPRLTGAAPRARALVLTALRDPTRAEAALRAGARGLVHKDASPEKLAQAIRVVAAGGLWFDPRIVEAASRPGEPADPAAARLASLTPREREIVLLIGEGLRNEEAGRRLGISEKTVRNHLTAIFDKLGVSGRLELLVFAYRHGQARTQR